MSALTRMANRENRWLEIGAGDTVILSSHPIPGNEMSVSKVIDGLVRLGAKVVHSGLEDVHATGHAKQEEIKTLLSVVEPQWFVPVHGEYRHLVHHAELAQIMGVPEERTLICEDGDQLTIDDDGISRHRPGAGRLPLRRRHRRRRRPGRAARPAGAGRGGRRGRGRHRGARHRHDPHRARGHHPRLGLRPRGRGAARGVRRRSSTDALKVAFKEHDARPRRAAAGGAPRRRASSSPTAPSASR